MRQFILAVGLVLAIPALAADLQSAHFNDSEPIITISGGLSTSSHFQLITGLGQTVIGESTSTNFIGRSGWLYFPLVSAPSLAATAGDASAALSWSPAVGVLGINVSGYQVGQATVSGGPYSYTNVGDVLTSARSGLTNGTTYYFVVRALDFYNNPVVTSTQVSATPVGTGGPTPGAGGVGTALSAGLAVNGETAPNGVVTIIRDGVKIGELAADNTGFFAGSFDSLPTGQSVFTFFSRDLGGNRSAPATMLLNLVGGQVTTVSSLILAPSISTENSEVKQGEPINVVGSAAPGSEVTLYTDPDRYLSKTTAGRDGKYNFQVGSGLFKTGPAVLKVRAQKRNQVSEWSIPLDIIIGDKTVKSIPVTACQGKADFNHDCRVNIVDFSILLYWFYLPNVPAEIDLSNDGKVGLRDFSILIYYWTD